MIRSAAAGRLNPERFTEEARKERVNGWNEGFLRRLQNAGGLVRLELLEIKAQDGVSRMIYRAKFEHESMLLTLVSNQSRKISALKLAAE